MNKLTITLLFLAIPSGMFAQANYHPDLKPYHDRFISEANARGITSFKRAAPGKMQFFEDRSRSYRGVLILPENNLYINKLYWDTASEAEREILAFHELAHCYLDAGEIRHVRNHIMNPLAVITDWWGNRMMYLDLLFTNIYETPGDRKHTTLTAGSLIITSDSPESQSFRVHELDGDTQRMRVLMDSITSTHYEYDYIFADMWRFKTFEYKGPDPVVRYDGRVNEVWGEGNRMYMYQMNPNKAPKLGDKGRIRWNEKTEMTLVFAYKNWKITVRKNATIMFYVKNVGDESKIRGLIN
jgi:hypothetical protein